MSASTGIPINSHTALYPSPNRQRLSNKTRGEIIITLRAFLRVTVVCLGALALLVRDQEEHLASKKLSDEVLV